MTNTKRIYLADTENEGGGRYREILNSDMKNEEMVLLYTKHAKPISWDEAQLITGKHKDKVQLEACNCGKNGLDFQLTSMLGFMIAKEPHIRYIILSNDHGYDPCVEYWKEKGVKVERMGYHKDFSKEEPSTNTKTEVKEKEEKKTGNASGAASDPYQKLREKIIRTLKTYHLEGYDVNKLVKIYAMQEKNKMNAFKSQFGIEATEKYYSAVPKKVRKGLAA